MYTIYKGLKSNGDWKIGCDQDYPNRPKFQNLTDYYILEQHEDIMVASNRERELQKEHGVKVDKYPYYTSIQNSGWHGIHTKEHQANAGKGGKGIPKPHSSELARNLNIEWQCEYCQKTGKGIGNFKRYGHHNNTCR